MCLFNPTGNQMPATITLASFITTAYRLLSHNGTCSGYSSSISHFFRLHQREPLGFLWVRIDGEGLVKEELTGIDIHPEDLRLQADATNSKTNNLGRELLVVFLQPAKQCPP